MPSRSRMPRRVCFLTQTLTPTRPQTGELQVLTKAEALKHRNASLGKVKLTQLQKLSQEWVESVFTELLIMVLLVLDVCLTFYELMSTRPDELAHTENPLMVMTGGILFVFFFESLVRIMGYRWSLFNGTRVLDFVDIFIVYVSIVVYAVTIAMNSEGIAKVATFARAIRFLRILKFARRLRKWVGLNRRRYKKDGFDLDLTYITPSVIAMSLPSVGTEANYRWEHAQTHMHTLKGGGGG